MQFFSFFGQTRKVQVLFSFAPACHCPRNFAESWTSRTVIVIVKNKSTVIFHCLYALTNHDVKCSKHAWNHKPHHFYGLYEYGPWKFFVDLLDLGMTVRAALAF